MWDLPRPGLEPVSPALAGRFSTTAPPAKPMCCSLIWKGSHSDCHLGTDDNLSFPFPSPSSSVSCSAWGQWEGKVIAAYKLWMDTSQGIFPNTSKNWKVTGLLSPEQFETTRHCIKSTSIFETISDTLKMLLTSSLVSSNAAFGYCRSS